MLVELASPKKLYWIKYVISEYYSHQNCTSLTILGSKITIKSIFKLSETNAMKTGEHKLEGRRWGQYRHQQFHICTSTYFWEESSTKNFGCTLPSQVPGTKVPVSHRLLCCVWLAFWLLYWVCSITHLLLNSRVSARISNIMNIQK